MKKRDPVKGELTRSWIAMRKKEDTVKGELTRSCIMTKKRDPV